MAFKYHSLNSPTEEIRLLKIHPGQDEEVLKCTLTTDHSLGHATCPPYAALSYTWGAMMPQYTIELNEAKFSIRENLWFFLRQLRRSREHEYIWTDAICIDQSNVPEKNAQVPLMGRIYENAARVFVWLGQEADQSHLIMNLAAQHAPSCSASECAVDWSKVNLFQYAPALFRLCNRPYWDRTWIIQEIKLARGEIIVFCGSRMTTLQSLKAVHGSYCDFALFQGGDTASFGGAEDYDFTEKDGLHRLSYDSSIRTLERLLEVYQETLCSDPKDKVYAVQSMAVDSPLIVDYSMDLNEFYWRVLAHCNTSNPQFGKILRHSLGISLRSLWDFARQKNVLSSSPIMQTSSNLELVASAQLTVIGLVNSVNDARNESHLQQERSNGVARVQFTPSSLPIRGLHCVTGFASAEVQEADLICVLDSLSGCGLVIRRTIVSPRALRNTDASEDSSQMQIHSSFCLLMEPEDHQSSELDTIIKSQHRLNTLADSIVVRGLARSHFDQPVMRSEASVPSLSLILNYAAVLAIAEISELVQHGIEWSGMTMFNGPGNDLQPE